MTVPTTPATVHDHAAGIALTSLSAMGPRRLRRMVQTWGLAETWTRLVDGPAADIVECLGPEAGVEQRASVEKLVNTWRTEARTRDPARLLAAHRAADVLVLTPSEPDYPSVLRDDIEPPQVLFARGDLGAIEAPRVAIVGTRRCTGTGAGMARELGRELSAAGVAVVSGLALGIDGAAHRGVFDALPEHPRAARPVAVVGSGIDVVYPARHRDLWVKVADHGLILSEAPLGTRPAAWRFPARNRVLAALAGVVVVVESHRNGGSMHTVEQANRRGIDVMVVPGSVRNAASEGVNHLLSEGCQPVCATTDVLVALGLGAGRRRRSIDHRPTPSATAAQVLDAFDWEPATVELLAVRSGLPIDDLAVALESLIATGWVALNGGWLERVAP